MNRFHLIVAGLGLAGVTVPVVASAAPWQSINARQDRLEQRIERGIRSGQLSRREAMQLRTQYREIARLEDRYRRSDGLSGRERQDINRRFDALSARVRVDRQDRRHR